MKKKMWFYYAGMCPEEADRMAPSADSDQTSKFDFA